MSGPRVIALSGGVGGAKLAHGLAMALEPGELGVAVNTGDDFVHLGLPICPDVDTVVYTLAGLADRERGWGREGETWHFMEALGALRGPEWFNLGDRDLAMHVWRGSRLAAGETLSAVTGEIAERLGIAAQIWPMCDEPVQTVVLTDEGELPFQEYFVARRCAPVVRSLRFAGAEQARPTEALRRALAGGGVEAIVLCPSNPWLSIDPILAVPGMAALLRDARPPVVAVSPIVGGDAVKGPTAKIMRELGVDVNHRAIARHYDGLIDGLVIDAGSAAEGEGLPLLRTDTLMRDEADRARLARETLAFAATLRDTAA